jgi:predicted alpha/beta hydrolase family esterase
MAALYWQKILLWQSGMQQQMGYLIVPGWQGSDAEHWQSHWQRTLPNCRRVEQVNWFEPELASWINQLEQAIEASAWPVILIAHSLGCIAVAHWAKHASQASLVRVRGALFVAPADVERVDCPPPLLGFAPIPKLALPFPCQLLGSDNDPAAQPERVAALAAAWQVPMLILSGVGHLNVASGHRCWPEGLVYLNQLQCQIEQQKQHQA